MSETFEISDDDSEPEAEQSSSGTEQMAMKEGHYAEEFHSRHHGTTVEVWCPTVDETKVIMGRKYVRHCPMCGDSIKVAP